MVNGLGEFESDFCKRQVVRNWSLDWLQCEEKEHPTECGIPASGEEKAKANCLSDKYFSAVDELR